MAMSGLTASPLRYSSHLPVRCPGLLNKRVLVSPDISRLRCAGFTRVCSIRQIPLVQGAMEASYDNSMGDYAAVFPRINVRDPYKRLGISREASEEEIQSARNFLIQRYAGHKPSEEAIESAHDKIVMQKFNERKNPKINMKKKVREVTQSPAVQAVTSRFRTPATSFMIKTSVAFVVLGALTIFFPTEDSTFTLWGWRFHPLLVARNILDGIYYPTYT